MEKHDNSNDLLSFLTSRGEVQNIITILLMNFMLQLEINPQKNYPKATSFPICNSLIKYCSLNNFYSKKTYKKKTIFSDGLLSLFPFQKSLQPYFIKYFEAVVKTLKASSNEQQSILTPKYLSLEIIKKISKKIKALQLHTYCYNYNKNRLCY